MSDPKITRGGLKAASITDEITNDKVYFMFNPFEFTLTKQNNWQDKENTGRNIPKVEFKSGGPVTLKLTLHFDTQLTGGDVRAHTNRLWQMMMIKEETKNQDTNKGQPPPVTFSWGEGMFFKAVITNMTQKFTLFSEGGVPLRCTVDISLKQYFDENIAEAQILGMSPGQGTQPMITVVEGQRIDVLASSSGSKPQNYREIAANNNINDPLNIPNGTNLKA